MVTIAFERPSVVHALPGRLRLHVGRAATGEARLEDRLLAIEGVTGVRSNPQTGNVLVLFDPAMTDQQTLLAAASGGLGAGETDEVEANVATIALTHAPRALIERDGPPLPFLGHAGVGQVRRARVAVRGMDRDPEVARRAVERLQRHPGVRAFANMLTGRVLVEFRDHQTDLDDVLATLTDVELPDDGGEDRPAHPLDPAPLLQSAGRLVAAGIGLGLILGQRAFGGPGGLAVPAGRAAALVGIAQAFPVTRFGLRALLGRNVADFTTAGASVAALALSGNPIGLALAGAEALRLLTEVTARRTAWREYEERVRDRPTAQPGAEIRLDTGERAPLRATVLEGTATALGRDALPVPVVPGTQLHAGDRIFGGPLLLRLEGGAPFRPQPRPAPVSPTLLDRYANGLAPLSLAYAATIGIASGSFGQALAGLALVNPRPALIGAEAATIGAAARVLRAGVTIVGTRPERGARLPDVLLIDGVRLLTDGLEAASVTPVADGYDATQTLSLAASVAAAAGSPWGGTFRAASDLDVQEGSFDGSTATALLQGVRYTLAAAGDANVQARRDHARGSIVLALRREGDTAPLALFTLRPKLAPGVARLIALCRGQGVEVAVLPYGDRQAARAVSHRAGVTLLAEEDLVTAVRERQTKGAVVALLSDSAEAAAAFEACDLGIALSSGRSSRFAARADLLAPDLAAVAAIISAGARSQSATRDSVGFSAIANVAGAIWGVTGRPGFARASLAVYIAALAALADGWARLRGGDRPRSALAHVADPQPERWGRRSIEQVLSSLQASPDGLSTIQAAARLGAVAPIVERNALWRMVVAQVQTPIAGILLVGAGVSAVLGSPLDVLLIVATLGVGVAVGVWQERRADQAAAMLGRLGAATGRVLRDGRPVVVPAEQIVPGDVLLLAPGDRVVADARLLSAHNLEVDEAALTGESLPVAKAAGGLTGISRVVLEGSDVTVGAGRAVVVAVGRGTRLGATAAALALDDADGSPLADRLSGILRQVLPVAGVGGIVVVASGLLRGLPLLPQLAIGASIAIAAVPEGLPLLSGVGQAAVAARLAERQALVRRIGAVEALGRVDVACTDKTGTLTEGKPALTLVAGLENDATLRQEPNVTLPPALLAVLQAAGLASPHPDHPSVAAHPTDVAVIVGAERAGLGQVLRQERTAEAPFDPARAFHSSVSGNRLHVKGAIEALLPRCGREAGDGVALGLDEGKRACWRARAEGLAARGLRVLMVAEGSAASPVDDPTGLTALGFIGISDPLRGDVRAAVGRCRDAGIRVVMVTGDHPATAAAIAREAGILDGSNDDVRQDDRRDDHAPGGRLILAGSELADLDDADLDRRLDGVTVIARVTPLDKLRIVESLQRRGHTVAMTGDGVNDAPALRLADVGVAMGRGGTEVARQAADVVLADDNFATLVEALVEGRSFWRNIRRALALLLGGNLGELGLVVGAGVLGLASPLITRQILAVNLITDALPALAVAIQPPADRNLADLAREGTRSLDQPLRNEVLRRGALSAAPSLAAFALALPGGLPSARAVALGSIVTTQLVQTLEAGRGAEGVHRSVLVAVGASGAVLVAALTLPILHTALAISGPAPYGWMLIGGATLTTALFSRVVPDRPGEVRTTPVLPSPPPLKMLPGGAS